MFSELFAPVSIGVRTIAKTVRILERNQQWKKPGKRQEELKKRWKDAPEIGEFAYSSNRYWAIAKAYPIHQALSNQNLWNEGWYDLEKALRETR